MLNDLDSYAYHVGYMYSFNVVAFESMIMFALSLMAFHVKYGLTASRL